MKLTTLFSHCFLISLLYFNVVISGEDCKVDTDCGEHFVCINETCSCSPDYVYNDERTKCLRVSHGYGAECSESVQCSASLLAGGMCSNGQCICTDGYHYLKGQCWKTAGLGESCKQNMSCYVDYDFEASFCSSGNVCECSEGYYQREYSSCRRISNKPGEPCGISLDCKFSNAICDMNRVCQVDTPDTKPIVELSEYIVEHNREKRGILNFMEAFKYTGLTKIGDACKTDNECPANAKCYMNSICLCNQGYYTNSTKDNNSTCHPELGEACKTDADCLGKNTICRGGEYCACLEGFVTSYDSRYCDKMSREIDWSCLRDEQCGFFGPGGKCVTKKCHCSNSTHWVQNQFYCWVSRNSGENCVETEDCGGINASMTCKDSKCTCVSSTHPSTTKRSCNKDATEVGQPCVENIDCMYNHGYCNTTSKNCTCAKNYLENGKSCSPGIFAPCQSSGECFVTDSQCVNKTCVCPENHVPSKNLDSCYPVADTINVQCYESDQCMKVEGLCTEGKCLCRNGSQFWKEDNRCYISRIIGQSCTVSRNCTVINSICQNYQCMCPRGYKVRGIACVNRSSIGSPSQLLGLLISLFFLVRALIFKY